MGSILTAPLCAGPRRPNKQSRLAPCFILQGKFTAYRVHSAEIKEREGERSNLSVNVIISLSLQISLNEFQASLGARMGRRDAARLGCTPVEAKRHQTGEQAPKRLPLVALPGPGTCALGDKEQNVALKWWCVSRIKALDFQSHFKIGGK